VTYSSPFAFPTSVDDPAPFLLFSKRTQHLPIWTQRFPLLSSAGSGYEQVQLELCFIFPHHFRMIFKQNWYNFIGLRRDAGVVTNLLSHHLASLMSFLLGSCTQQLDKGVQFLCPRTYWEMRLTHSVHYSKGLPYFWRAMKAPYTIARTLFDRPRQQQSAGTELEITRVDKCPLILYDILLHIKSLQRHIYILKPMYKSWTTYT